LPTILTVPSITRDDVSMAPKPMILLMSVTFSRW
jgi:hypothetical protein